MKKYQAMPDEIKDGMTAALLFKRFNKAYGRWRALAVLSCLTVILYSFFICFSSPSARDHLVKLHLDGEISDMDQVRKASSLLEDDSVKGILVTANSPGGSPSVSEAWGKLFKRLQDKGIPVVTIAQEVCASGCYLAVVNSDRIFSYESSLIGSIGAVMMSPNVSDLLEKWDVHVDVIKSGILKAEPNPLSVRNPLYHDEMQNLVSSVGKWFTSKVINAREIISEEHVDMIDSGEVFLAHQALRMNLIDEMADEIEAMAYLRTLVKSPQMSFETFDLKDHSWFEDVMGIKSLAFHSQAWITSQLDRIMLR